MPNYPEQCKVKILSIRGGDISDEEYFKLPGISNSKLKLLNPREGGSIELYKSGFPHGFNPSLSCGSAVHCILLQPEEFVLSDYEGKPSGKCGFFIDKFYKHRKEGEPIYKAMYNASLESDYYAGKLSPKLFRKTMEKGLEYYLKLIHGDFNIPGKTVIVESKSILDNAKECIDSVNKNYDIQSILKQDPFNSKEYYNEIALFANIEVTFPDGNKQIVPFKGKLDSVVIDNYNKKVYLNDLKTTSNKVDYFMDVVIDGVVYSGNFSKHHYWRQLAKLKNYGSLSCKI